MFPEIAGSETKRVVMDLCRVSDDRFGRLQSKKMNVQLGLEERGLKDLGSDGRRNYAKSWQAELN